jgi:tripartite-type tricarboxylate transporter receptor subunit TctC
MAARRQEDAMTRAPVAVVLLGLGLLLTSAERSLAQSDYPTKPVTFIVPFAPGGTTDILARLVSQRLEQRLGKPFIVENRPGGGGLSGAVAVTRAPPDGYTLIMASSTMMAINVTFRKNLPYDPRKDMTPLALLARIPFALVVNPSLPVHSVSDLVKLAKEKPGQLSYGTPGPGTMHHLQTEMLKNNFGLDLIHVPYKGAVPALNDLAGGHIHFMISDLPPAISLVQAGKIRAIGVTTAQRVPIAPELPPLAEVGYPGYDVSSWHSVATTAGVPEPIVNKLNNTIREIMAEPQVVGALARDGALPQVTPSPAEMKRFVDSEITRWGKVIEQAGLAGSE